VNGKIDPTLGQCLLNFLGEHSLRADLRERYIDDLVAGSVNDFDLDFMPLRTQERSNVIRLPESQLRAARTNPQTQALVSLPFLEVPGSLGLSFQ